MGISTAIKTASIVALYDFFDDPLAPLNGQLMGPRASCQMPQNLLFFYIPLILTLQVTDTIRFTQNQACGNTQLLQLR